jgi:hypothetical protein
MNDRKIKGVTLFEMLLVLLVIMVLVATFFTFSGRKTQGNAAEQLGFRLYQYGLAVTDYARINPDNYDANTELESIYGYEWLQEKTNPETGQPFLGASFSLDITPLKIAEIDPGEPYMQTILSINALGQNEFEVLVDLIEVGMVSRPLPAGKRDPDAPSGTAYQADPALAAAAATYANNYRTDAGPAAITYKLAGDFKEPEELLLIGEPRFDLGTSEYWLQTDGRNQMQGSIRFNPEIDAANRRVTGVDNIEFFDGQDAIMKFRGFRLSELFVFETTQYRGHGDPVVINGKSFYATDSICYLESMQTPPSSADNCRVTLVQVGGQHQWYLIASRTGASNNPLICNVRCVMFDW